MTTVMIAPAPTLQLDRHGRVWSQMPGNDHWYCLTFNSDERTVLNGVAVKNMYGPMRPLWASQAEGSSAVFAAFEFDPNDGPSYHQVVDPAGRVVATCTSPEDAILIATALSR